MVENQGQQADHDHVDGRFNHQLNLLGKGQENCVDSDVDVFLLGQMAAQHTHPHEQKPGSLIRPGGRRADFSGKRLPEKGEQNDVEEDHCYILFRFFQDMNGVGRRFDSGFANFHN